MVQILSFLPSLLSTILRKSDARKRGGERGRPSDTCILPTLLLYPSTRRNRDKGGRKERTTGSLLTRYQPPATAAWEREEEKEEGGERRKKKTSTLGTIHLRQSLVGELLP